MGIPVGKLALYVSCPHDYIKNPNNITFDKKNDSNITMSKKFIKFHEYM